MAGENVNFISVQHLLFCPSHPLSPLPARNRRSEAEPLFRQVLELRQRVLGPEHPGTISSINSLAACLHDMGRWAGSDATECGWGYRCSHHLSGVCVGELGRQAAAGLSGPERVVACEGGVCMDA